MKDIKEIKKIISGFIELRVEELCEAKEGKNLAPNDIQKLCDQIIEFMHEHFGSMPGSFYQKMKEAYKNAPHLMQLPFTPGGLIAPNPIISLLSLLRSSGADNNKGIELYFKMTTEKQLDEMWPEYKDRWKD